MSRLKLLFIGRSRFWAGLAVALAFLLGGETPVAAASASAASPPEWMLRLPTVNACFNALSAVLLAAGFVFIRRKQPTAHRNCMLAALASSTLFLAGYLTYHFAVHTVTKFREPEWFRPIYLTILLTHTVLAVVIVPLIFITLNHALRQRFDPHRKIARWTWPLWMYVSATGVLIYWLLYVKFPQH